ncbi:MAG: hypothetical protein R6V47_07165, partial [Candidatus Delongbacteria bacterium]
RNKRYYGKLMLRSALKILILLSLMLLISCISGNDEDDIDMIDVDKMPLAKSNKWIFDINRGSVSYTDSAEIIDILPYGVNGSAAKFLYLFKEIALTKEILDSDTAYIKLIEYESDRLLQYGKEKRDRSPSFFLHDETQIFDAPHTLLDHFKPTLNLLYESDSERIESVGAEKLHIDSLEIVSSDTITELKDTYINCIKVRHNYSGSFMDFYPDFDLCLYYTDYGIMKIEGYVNGNDFIAQAKKIILN